MVVLWYTAMENGRSLAGGWSHGRAGEAAPQRLASLCSVRQCSVRASRNPLYQCRTAQARRR